MRLVPAQFPACYARQRLAQAALGNGSQCPTIELESRVRQAPYANQVRGSPGRRLSGVRGARPRQLFGAPVEKSYTSRANIESGDLGRPTATAISRRNVGSIAHPARAASITSAADANKANYERAPPAMRASRRPAPEFSSIGRDPCAGQRGRSRSGKSWGRPQDSHSLLRLALVARARGRYHRRRQAWDRPSLLAPVINEGRGRRAHDLILRTGAPGIADRTDDLSVLGQRIPPRDAMTSSKLNT